MANPTAGYGAVPGEIGDQGVSKELLKELNADTMAEDIHAIRLKYVGDDFFDPLPIALAVANASQTIDLLQSPHNSVIISVITGTVNLFVGNYGGVVSAIPHAQFAATGQPVQLMFPKTGRVYTVVASGGAATLTLIPVNV